MNISSSIGGMNNAISTINNSAKQISQTHFNDSIDLAKETVNQIKGSANLKSNIQTIKTSDEMMGTLLDMVG